ncbi:hypothetical protein [Pontiella sp.]|uniref:hypothetical protein n=1 Tax=Pontiella sp. TaxID=2837462 RepID=UPI003563DE65
MSTLISQKTLDAASNCKHNHICTTNEGKPFCTIESVVGNTVFFTGTRHTPGCVYQCSFGSAYMCTCPVRQELFVKHGI